MNNLKPINESVGSNPKSEIVAIGSSLGGMNAVDSILRALPADYTKIVVLLQHRGPDSEDRLVSILQARSSLPVAEVEDKEPFLAGRVYLAPTGYHLLVERGHASLCTEPAVNFALPSIDVFFDSVASSYGQRAVGVLLTGASVDGAQGLLAMKSAGALTIAQDPKTAEAVIMPEAAIAIQAADLIIPLDQIGPFLAALK